MEGALPALSLGFVLFGPDKRRVKYFLYLLLCLPVLAAQADDAIRLNCPPRGNITVSFFNYYLITMKWGDHFQVASGKSKNHTKNGQRYWTTTFGNGDGLAYFPDTQQYYLFYAGSDEPVPCTEHGSYVYPVITPPRYENSLADRQEQAQASDSDTDDSPVVLSRPGTQG